MDKVNVGTIGHVDHGRRVRTGGRRHGIISGLALAAATCSVVDHNLDDQPITPATYVHNPFAKHKRNDPCPCNSGKKWKKCHMNKG